MAFLSLLPFQQIHIFLTFALRDFQRRHSLFNGQPHRFHEVFDRGQDNGYNQTQKNFSEHTAQRIDDEVNKLVQFCYEQGEKILSENRDKLDLLATTLVEKETLQATSLFIFT